VITAYLVGDAALIARLNAMPDRLRSGIVRTVTRLGFQLEARVKQKLSGEVLKVRTGTLRNSINTRVAQTASSVTAAVGTNVKYARIQEFGGHTPPHTILPKRGRVLAFEWKGQQVFFRKVQHPGSRIPEHSFLRSALREMEPRIKAELEAAVHETVSRR
jgi:HK97 gp10 family phage protein